MNGKIFGILAVLIVILGGWLLLPGDQAKAPTSETSVSDQMPVVGSTTPEMIVDETLPEVIVEYTDKGFSPKDVSVELGTTVVFVNKSSGKMWVASASHPTHTVYSGTSLSQHCPDTTESAFDQCLGEEPGENYSFTFNKEGVWKYHDHINASRFGSVTVTAATIATSTLIIPI